MNCRQLIAHNVFHTLRLETAAYVTFHVSYSRLLMYVCSIIQALLEELIARSIQAKSAKVMLRR